MLITPERKVSQRSDTSQNDHKSKGYPPKPSEAFTLQKAPCAAAFERVFQKFDFPALVERCLTQFVRVLPYEILVLLTIFIFFRRNEIISLGKKRSALFQTNN